MPLEDILVHTARKWALTEGETWVEGEYEEGESFGPEFDCCLFLPQGSKAGAGRGRMVREPTLLFSPEDNVGGAPVALKPEDEVYVVAPELNLVEGRAEDAEVRWMVNGAAQPFGKPGEDVIGFQVTLRRIED